MASTVIHMAVAKKVNEVLRIKNENHFLLGAIAPDIAKMIGLTRNISHFIVNEEDNVPGIDLFLSKYKKYLNNPYELGYYVHLLTDVLWIKEYLPNIWAESDTHIIYDKFGNPKEIRDEDFLEIIYNDYTNLNPEILSYYNMDFSLFYEKFTYPSNHIKEVDEKYFPKIIEKFSSICSKESDALYVMKLESIIHFIEYAAVFCLDEIRKIDL